VAVKFEVQNPDALASAVAKLEAAMSESTLRKGAAAGASVLKNEVMVRTPADTGELREGLTVAYAPEDSVTGKIATYVVTFVGEYPPRPNGKPGMRKRDVAGWLENGTSKMAARPFVRPAYEAKRQAAVDKTQAVISAALEGKG
jgi:HK97 gp10 family phage protein